MRQCLSNNQKLNLTFDLSANVAHINLLVKHAKCEVNLVHRARLANF